MVAQQPELPRVLFLKRPTEPPAPPLPIVDREDESTNVIYRFGCSAPTSGTRR